MWIGEREMECRELSGSKMFLFVVYGRYLILDECEFWKLDGWMDVALVNNMPKWFRS